MEKTVSLQELYSIRQNDAQNLEQLKRAIYSYMEAIGEAQLAKETIANLEKGKGKIKIRIGANIFIDAEIKDTDIFFENLAGEFIREKTKDEAIVGLNKNIATLEKKIQDLRKKERELNQNIANYDAAFRAAYQDSQKTSEEKNQTKNNPKKEKKD